MINIRINRTLSSLSSTQDKKKLRKTPLNLKSKDDLNQNKNFITTSDNKGKKERKKLKKIIITIMITVIIYLIFIWMVIMIMMI